MMDKKLSKRNSLHVLLIAIVITQVLLSFYLLYRLHREVMGIEGTIASHSKAGVFEVGGLPREHEELMSRTRLTPEYLMGFVAGRTSEELYLRTSFDRRTGNWCIMGQWEGEVFEVSGPTLSNVCNQVLDVIDAQRNLRNDDQE